MELEEIHNLVLERAKQVVREEIKSQWEEISEEEGVPSCEEYFADEFASLDSASSLWDVVDVLKDMGFDDDAVLEFFIEKILGEEEL